MKLRQAVYISQRNDFVHHTGERVARSEFKDFGNTGRPARLHTRGPIHRLFDLARQFFGAGQGAPDKGARDPSLAM